jgi:glycosyltransferase involved in cell wall biosynthesis
MDPSHRTAPRDKMRISMVTPWDQVCGNAEYAKRLVRGLSAFAHVTPHEMINISERFNDDGELLTRRFLNEHFGSLARRIKQCPSDIVHIQHEFGFFGSSFREADRRFRSLVNAVPGPIVVTLHTLIPAMCRRPCASLLGKVKETVLHWWRTWDMRVALRRADAIISHSFYTHRRLSRAFPELKKKLHVVPIAIEKFPSNDSNRWTKHQGERWVVVPGFVSSYKGHDYALEAMRFLPENFKLVVAGGLHPKDPGSAETWMHLLGKADELRVRHRITFTDFITDPRDQAELFEKADIFLLPYHEVGQSGSAALADVMAYGRPVVTSLAKSMFVYRMDRDTVNSAISVDVGKPRLLASCIRECLERDSVLHDTSHRYAACVRYDLRSTSAKYEKIYRELLGS